MNKSLLIVLLYLTLSFPAFAKNVTQEVCTALAHGQLPQKESFYSTSWKGGEVKVKIESDGSYTVVDPGYPYGGFGGKNIQVIKDRFQAYRNGTLQPFFISSV